MGYRLRVRILLLKEKLEPDSNVRMRAGIVHILHHNERNGHTCLPKEKLLKVSTDFLGIDGEKVSECMEEMLFDRSLIEDKIDGKNLCFLPMFTSAKCT